MIVREILGRVYCYCTKMELPEVLTRLSDFTMVFVVTSVNDLTDLLRDLQEKFGIKDDLGKFIVMRRAGFLMEQAQDYLENVSSELFASLRARAEEHLPLMPFKPLASRTVYARYGTGFTTPE